MSGQFRMSVNVFIDPKQRGKLSVSERLRRLLRQNERRNPHRQQQNQQRTNLHSGFISTDFADFILLSFRAKSGHLWMLAIKRFLDFPRNDRKFVSQWNLRRTRCSSARTRRRESSPLNWAKPAPCVCIGGKLMVRPLPTSNRFTRLSGPTQTLSILASRRKNFAAI